MERYMKFHEAGWNTEEHGEFPAPVKENAIEPASHSAVQWFLLLFAAPLTLAASLLIIVVTIVVSP